MMPANVMAAARAAQLRRMPFTGEIHRPVRVEDEYGGYTDTWQPVGLTPMAVVQGQASQQGLEGRLADRIGANPFFVVILPHDADITTDDRILELSPNPRHFEVLAVPNRDVTYETACRVIVIEHGEV